MSPRQTGAGELAATTTEIGAPPAVAEPSWLPPLPPDYAPTAGDVSRARETFTPGDYAGAAGALHYALRRVLAGEPYADVAVRFALAARQVAIENPAVSR